jgi:purine-nucleoside phosphorylase
MIPMDDFFTVKDFAEAADFIRGRTRYVPAVGLILGSGLSPLADAVTDADVIPYEEIPHFPIPHVEGHAGRLVMGRLEGRDVLVMQGRVHYYEGYSMQHITLPVRVMRTLGVEMLIVTNAAGGLDPRFHPGDLMLITDHINLAGMAGLDPLRGPNDPALGSRFPDMSQAYDPALRALALRVAEKLDLPVWEGVYISLAGPVFETPADIRFLRLIGVDAVGMSTVPEVVVARHGGMRVLGISGISNVSITEPTSGNVSSHEEVIQAGQVLVPRLVSLLRGVLRELDTV